MPPRSEEETQL